MELIQQEYARPKFFMIKYNVSRTTLWRLLQNMKTRPKFKNSFRRTSPGVELINIADFDRFMVIRTAELERV
ncbi:hypothetical protein [Veillonella criceti]|uniref:Helix-turn-helix domain n=1 Tax=Veillonella criceti TaxID=103891 RepID=A0A380NMM7_9FIRM|nr:hypothetical protein [Veillonella criceti]SUP44358.1 Uncharacterised protein [Veillonella criceti]SUP79497.1 Uncharacterised protein [Veillonella criceti]